MNPPAAGTGFEPMLAAQGFAFRRTPQGTGTSGMLAVPDFDAPPPPPVPDIELAVAAEEVLQARLAAARAEGFAAGEAAGLRQAATERHAAETAALAAIAAALDGAAVTAAEVADTAAAALAGLLLAALDAALPEAAARLAPEGAAGLAAALRPLLDEAVSVTLMVATGCGAATAARIGDARIEVREDAALAPGDARASWRGGGAVLSLAERRGAVAEVLTALGLQEA